MEILNFSEAVSSQSITELLEDLRSTRINRVYVNSPGGRFDLFSRVGPAIRERDITMIAGEVRSAAVILYLLGAERLAYPESIFHFHDVRSIVDGEEITICDLQEFLDEQSSMQGEEREEYEEWLRSQRQAEAWLTAFLAEHMRVTPGFILKLMHNEITLNAQEALRYNIVQKIITRS